MQDVYYKRPDISLEEATEHLGRNWVWVLLAGLALAVIGAIALMTPLVSTLGLTLALAGVFTASGVVQLVQAFKLREHQGALNRFLHALLALALGAVMLWIPEAGMLVISMMLSVYFFLNAIIGFMFAQTLAPQSARVWAYVNAAASFILGFYIVFTYPLSALWIPGTLLGIELVVTGAGLAGLAFSIRKLHHQHTTGAPHVFART